MPAASVGRFLAIAGLVVAALGWSAVANAQTGGARGTVTTADGQPVTGARVVFSFAGDMKREIETTTNAKGTFVKMGLRLGPYTVHVTKDGLLPAEVSVRVSPGQIAGIDFSMRPDSGISSEDVARLTLATAAFKEGLAASEAGRYDEAIAKFNEALQIEPTCVDCLLNLGVAHTKAKNFTKAEETFAAASEKDPENPGAFEGLAAAYNAQRKFELAAQASARAATLRGGSAGGGESPDAVFDRGLIQWNAGNIAEARTLFEQTLQLDPAHGESHYWLGMADVNEGKLPEAAAKFRLYITAEPGGRFVDKAKGILAQIAPGGPL